MAILSTTMANSYHERLKKKRQRKMKVKMYLTIRAQINLEHSLSAVTHCVLPIYRHHQFSIFLSLHSIFFHHYKSIRSPKPKHFTLLAEWCGVITMFLNDRFIAILICVVYVQRMNTFTRTLFIHLPSRRRKRIHIDLYVNISWYTRNIICYFFFHGKSS